MTYKIDFFILIKIASLLSLNNLIHASLSQKFRTRSEHAKIQLNALQRDHPPVWELRSEKSGLEYNPDNFEKVEIRAKKFCKRGSKMF